MPIYRGSGGSGNSNTSANANQVAIDAAAAAQSATDAAASAAAALVSENEAESAETNAEISETNASNSATASANSATASSNSATASAASATLSDGSALASSDSATLAANSATAAANSETASNNSETAAANSATSATNSASSAAGSATSAGQSASMSSASANASAINAVASANSATASADSAAAAQAAQEAIDGLYLGAQSSDPTLDLNGDPVTVGDWYFNTTINKSKIYNGSGWDVLTSNGSVTSVTGAGTVNGVTLTGTVTTAGNLTLGGTLSGITASQLNSQDISQWTNDSGYTTNTGTVTPSSTDTFTNKSGNISQWTNDSGYLTSYTETDTLDSVTDRGATTTNDVTVGNLTSTGIDDNATSTAITLGSNGKITIDPAGSTQTTHELSVREAASPRITIDDIAGTTTDVNAGLLLRYGTTNAGSLSFGGSADLALTNNLAGSMTFTTNSAERMRIDSVGNVGIGETSPTTAKVVIKHNAPQALEVQSTGANTGIRYVGTAGSWQVGTSSTGSFTAYDITNNKTPFRVDANAPTNTIRALSSGRVGIGTDDPTSTLDVSGRFTISGGSALANSVHPYMRREGGNLRIAGRSDGGSGGNIMICTGASEDVRVTVDPSGNVGIGAPAVSGVNAPLDVDKATLFNNCVANFGEFIPLSGYQRGVVNINGRVNGSDYPASLSMVVRNSANSNWLHGRIVYNNLNEFVIEKNGAGSTGGVEQFKIDAGGRQTNSHNQYTYGQQNYFIKSSTATGNVYLGNINGSFHLASNAYYIGGSLRRLDAGKTDSAALYLASNGEFYFQQVVGATAGSTATATSVAKIDASGNLLVGTTSGTDFKQKVVQKENLGVCRLENTKTSGITYDQFQILVNQGTSSAFHHARFYSGGVQQFGVRGDGVIYAQNTSVQSISDGRVKENVRDSEQGLDVITALRPVRFDFKEGFGNDQKNQLGFIAQEVEAVFPDAVMTASEEISGEEPLKSLGPASLIPVLVKAIQEQQTMIETLQAQVAELQGAS